MRSEISEIEKLLNKEMDRDIFFKEIQNKKRSDIDCIFKNNELFLKVLKKMMPPSAGFEYAAFKFLEHYMFSLSELKKRETFEITPKFIINNMELLDIIDLRDYLRNKKNKASIGLNEYFSYLTTGTSTQGSINSKEEVTDNALEYHYYRICRIKDVLNKFINNFEYEESKFKLKNISTRETIKKLKNF
jgi:hypothetical protein